MGDFKVGQLVKIVSNSRNTYKKIDLVGFVGEIIGKYYDKDYRGELYSVKIPGLENHHASAGGFWFPARDLEPETSLISDSLSRHPWVLVPDYRPRTFNCMCSLPGTDYVEEDICETARLQHMLSQQDTENNKEEYNMLPGYKTASIQFLSGTNKEKTYFYALYDDTIQAGDMVVVSTGHHGLALARVAFIGGPASYVSCDREIVCKVDTSAWDARKEKAVKLQQLKEDMDERVKAYQATALYELAAEKDPTLKAMLDQFKALQEG